MNARDPKHALMDELHTLQNAQLQIDPLINAIEQAALTNERAMAVEIFQQLIDIAQTGEVMDEQSRGGVYLPWHLLTPEQKTAMWVAGANEFATYASAAD